MSQPPVIRLRTKRHRPPLPPGLREYVWKRAAGRCDWCGSQLSPFRWECHHRQLRSRGGKDVAENLIALHPGCHSWAHHHPTEATAVGLLVPSWADPAAWPLTRHHGAWAQPTDRGWVKATPTADQAAL